MEGSVIELLNTIFEETKANLIIKKENETDKSLKSYLEQFCHSKTPSCLFLAKAVESGLPRDLLLTLNTLLNYDFVIEWFFNLDVYTRPKLEDLRGSSNLTEVVYMKSRAPELSEDRYPEKSNYAGFNQCSELGLKIFLKLANFMNGDRNKLKARQSYEITVFGMLLCFEHSKLQLWSSADSIHLSERLRAHLLSNTSMKDLLMKPSPWESNSCCFNDMLKLILPRLKSSNWKKNPGAISVYLVLLENFNFNIGCDLVLPPVLLLLDDFEEANIIAGLDGLNYILKNATKSELRWLGRIDVIFESLIKQLYTKNEYILKRILDNLFLVLQITSSKIHDFGKEDKSDKAVTMILSQMQIENQIVLRRVYCFYLINFVKLLGLACLKHKKLIFEVTFAYLECYDGEKEICRVNALRLLLEVMKGCWPRIHLSALEIVKSMVRLLHELCSPSYSGEVETRKAMLRLIDDCLKTLQNLAPGIKCSFQALAALNLEDDFRLTLEEIFK